jgi:hypothetical protein
MVWKEADSLLQLWNVAGSFTQRINHPPKNSMRHHLVAYQRSRDSSVSIVPWLGAVNVMLTIANNNISVRCACIT